MEARLRFEITDKEKLEIDHMIGIPTVLYRLVTGFPLTVLATEVYTEENDLANHYTATVTLVVPDDKQCVTIDEINRQRTLGWPDFEPEDYCHRCGNRNCIWYTDSDRFNLAIGGTQGIDDEWQGIICPACFIELHRAKTNLKTLWKLVPGTDFRGVDPDGSDTNGSPGRGTG